ncbi:MAG: hypothetical protein AAF193_09590, partial [Bacteroidota bacterium]
RYGEVIGTGGDVGTQTPYWPVTCLPWLKKAAYLDWSGLRPMSETEYEKACRGPFDSHAAYANGIDFYMELNDAMPVQVENWRTAEERITFGISEISGNIASNNPYDQYRGLYRVGIFAASVQNPTRINTGASYYGMMEMSGNAGETVISLGNSNTRDFSGLHGDGELSSSYNPSFSVLQDWSFASASGVGVRGYGGILITSRIVMDEHTESDDDYEFSYTGFRGCRTAP